MKNQTANSKAKKEKSSSSKTPVSTPSKTPAAVIDLNQTIEQLQEERAALDAQIIQSNPNKGEFFEIQRPLISIIENFLISSGPNGTSITLETFSKMSGVSKSNVGSILRGQRWAARCERQVIVGLAKVLKVPVLQIYLLSGFILPEDTIFEINMDQTLDAIYAKMSKDNMVNGRIPSKKEWDAMSSSLKLSFCQMYEMAVQKVLLRMATAPMTEKIQPVAQI